MSEIRAEKAGPIRSLDAMMAQEWIFFRDKLYRPMWVANYRLEDILEWMRRGDIQYALIERPYTRKLEGQLNLYQMDGERPLTPAEIRHDRRINK